MKALIAATLLGLGLGSAQAADAGPLVVAELFTSQGCSSCPPADRILSKLAERDDVLALSLPVTYWDYLGWDDTFARDAHAPRQRAYARRLERGRVYTPQLIIDGRASVVGSRRSVVERGVRAARAEKAEKPASADLSATRQGESLRIAAAGPAGDVVLVTYRPGHAQVDVRRGENAGRNLAYVNVVTDMRRIGRVKADRPFETELDAPRGTAGEPRACAIFIQDGATGPILAAAKAD